MGKQEEIPPLDPELESGPIEKRECRDILCCLVFLCALGAMLGIGIYAYRTGQPDLLAVPYDSDGKSCGVDYVDYPYIYFAAPWPGYLSRTVCVKKCPNFKQYSPNTVLECVPNTQVSTCVQTDININDLTNPPNRGDLSFPNVLVIYNTSSAFGRLCYPEADVLKKVNLDTAAYVTQSEEWMSDLRSSWEIILVSGGIAIVIGFVYMILMRYCSGVLTWLAILGFIGGCFVLGAVLYDKAKSIENDNSYAADNSNNQKKSVTTLKIIAYILWGIGVLTILLVICLFSKIRLAIAIVKTASLFMGDCPFSILIPLVIFVFLGGWLAYWITAALYLYSIGEISKGGLTPFASVKWTDQTRYLIIYFIFGGLWVNAFILAVNQFVLASTVSLWYFGQQKPHMPITRSVYRAFRYHLGSLAFGSLILAIVQFIRVILSYVQYQLKKMKQENGLVKCILCFCQCYMGCLERFIKFLNKNAYIQISITGKGFCGAAKDGFFLVIRNPAKFGIVASIGELFIFLGKSFIAACGTIAGFVIISYSEPWKSVLYSPVLPTIFFFIVSLAIGILFMSVYGMAIDTILQCFCLDEELNRTKGKDPQHAPGPLRDFMSHVDSVHRTTAKVSSID